MRLLRRTVFAFVFVAPLAVSASYLAATRTDAYAVATRLVENDPAIHARIPHIASMRLALFDGYRVSTFGTDAEAKFRFVVTGDATASTVDVLLPRSVGKWTLRQGMLRLPSGESVALEPRDLL